MLQVERDTRILAPDLSSNQSQVTVNATSLYLQTDKALNLLPDHQPEIGHLQPKMLDYSKSALTVSSVFMGVLIDCGVHVCGERGEGGGGYPKGPNVARQIYDHVACIFHFSAGNAYQGWMEEF